ncbi:MFS transporter [Halovenus sp. WSH3]|uniref:MFS transporter n=1 Tax=Halovenus carboxidivorans TaxID=2692199 RepID=A0A6B0SYU0_9EURY|nr:MFS transporter [Halovenus carboxidivorans]MXR50958.1 MFS transporter [Halovenus carboxidivorans]
MALNPNDRAIARFTMLGHGLVHWFELSIPIFLVTWHSSFDVSLATLGFIISLGYAPFGIGALPAGVLADRFGPKRLVLACLAGMSLSFMALAVANSVYLVGAALIGWGIAASVYHPAGMALISTGASQQGTVFAYHGMAGNAGIALGPFAAATLLYFLDWPLVAALLALPAVVGFLYGLRAEFDTTAAVDSDVDTEDEEALTLSGFLSNSRRLLASAFLVVFVLVAFEGLFYRGVLTFLPEILQGLPAMEGIELTAGLTGIEPGDYIYVGLLVVGIAGQYAGGKLTDRLPVERGLAGIFVVLAVLALAFVPVSNLGIAAVVVLCGVLGFFLFVIQPFYQVAVAQYTPPDSRGLSYGYTYLAEFGFGAASIAVGGFVLDQFVLGAFFAVLASFALVGSGLAVVLLVGEGRIDFIQRYETEPAD